MARVKVGKRMKPNEMEILENAPFIKGILMWAKLNEGLKISIFLLIFFGAGLFVSHSFRSVFL